MRPTRSRMNRLMEQIQAILKGLKALCMLVICAVVLSAAAVVFAAPASADETDDAFVAALENYGININDHNTAITMGHNVCAALDNGHDESFLVLDVMHDTHLSARQVGYFVGVSVVAYLPAIQRHSRSFTEAAAARSSPVDVSVKTTARGHAVDTIWPQ